MGEDNLIQEQSIWDQISNPRRTYTDGYGTQRDVYEPGYITFGRKVYNFFNSPNNPQVIGGAGPLELISPGSIAKLPKALKEAQQAINAAKKGSGFIRIGKSGEIVPVAIEEIRRVGNVTILPEGATVASEKNAMRLLESAKQSKSRIPYSSGWEDVDGGYNGYWDNIINAIEGKKRGGILNKPCAKYLTK